MPEVQLDRVDRRLLHALQIEPRASWSELAPAVGVDAATLGRRWERIRSEGIAWVTGHRNFGQGALIEIECEPAQLVHAAETLALDPSVFVLDETSGGRDLLASVFFDDIAALSQRVTEMMGETPGLRAARTHLINEVLVEGGSWRLRELNADEAERVPRARLPRARAARIVPAEVRTAIETELHRDGRTTVAAIAAKYDIGAQRIADGIATLRQSGALLLRTDIARSLSGWPIYAWYFVEAPARTIDQARQAIAQVPEVRLAVTASSRYNLILAVWLRRLADVNRFEIALEAALPGARIADRSVVLRVHKHMNEAIGLDSRSTGKID